MSTEKCRFDIKHHGDMQQVTIYMPKYLSTECSVTGIYARNRIAKWLMGGGEGAGLMELAEFDKAVEPNG